MTFTSSEIGRGVEGIYKVIYYKWTATGVTSGSILTPMTAFKYVMLVDKTGLNAGQSIDTTTTAKTVALAGLTSNDTGYLKVVGK
jgi:hypothetical protein